MDIPAATVKIDGSTYEIQPALIESTFLGVEDHGIFTFNLSLRYPGSSGQGAGGYSLDDRPRDETYRRLGTAFGCELIKRTIETVGVASWEKIPGARVYALRNPGWNGLVRGLHNIDGKGDPLIFAALVAEMGASVVPA